MSKIPSPQEIDNLILESKIEDLQNILTEFDLFLRAKIPAEFVFLPSGEINRSTQWGALLHYIRITNDLVQIIKEE